MQFDNGLYWADYPSNKIDRHHACLSRIMSEIANRTNVIVLDCYHGAKELDDFLKRIKNIG